MHVRSKMSEFPRRGAAAVEFAIVVPIIFMLLFGLIDFTRAYNLRDTLGNAAYEGARAGLVPGATVADVENEVKHILSILGIREASIVVTPSEISSATLEVGVTISVPMRANLFIGILGLVDQSLESSCVLRHEQATIQHASGS